MGIDSDLIRGHIDTIILKVLFEGDKYGYEICNDVAEKSGGSYEIKQPTLYSCLKRLESQGLISSYWVDSDIGGKRHYYKLTDAGKETYKKNQEEWLRSRQIIDNLISNSHEEASSFTLVKKEEIEELEKKAELVDQIEEKPSFEETVEENNEDSYLNIEPVTFDDNEEIIPWNTEVNVKENQESETAEGIEEESEELEETEEVSPAQSSIFEEDKPPFDVDEEQQVEDDEGEVDILELLGHTKKEELSYPTQELIEHTEELAIGHVEELALEESKNIVEETQDEDKEEFTPFNFKMEDFVMKSKNSYFDAEEDVVSSYTAPEMKIDGLEENQEEVSAEKEVSRNFDFESFRKAQLSGEDEQEEETAEKELEEESHVYHDFGADSFLANFNNKIEPDDDDIYVDTSSVSDDDIYLNPEAAKNEDAEEDVDLKLFTEDIFEETNEPSYSNEIEEEKEPETYNPFEEIIREPNPTPMDFYKTTESYDNLSPQYTDEQYKEKLSTLMAYGNYDKDEETQSVNYDFNNVPKDYSELKADFEKEGLAVRPHSKMVKESKQTRSYVESNKLNLVNSWTAFGFIAFFITLTFLIMNNYSAKFSGFNFSYKYFLIGIACIALIPAFYTIVYFINPYKKKQARYASRIYILFSILLTLQFLLIIYCVNLQLGFYSFSQANYNHLMWIIPSILALYPLADSILHTIYFNSKNFHV